MKHKVLALRLLKEWRDNKDSKIKFDISQFIASRGTKCCVIGYLALQPEFNKLGLVMSKEGIPYCPSEKECFCSFFDLKSIGVMDIFHKEGYRGKVTLQDVITKLEQVDET